jgi:hypothetical protein
MLPAVTAKWLQDFTPAGKAVDLADGAQAASARPAPSDRIVPPVPSAHRRVDATARAVKDVIE